MNQSDIEFELRSLRQEQLGLKADRDALKMEVAKLKDMQGILSAHILRLIDDFRTFTFVTEKSKEQKK